MMEKYLINERICPQPMKWNELYNILTKATGDNELPKPLILDAWHHTGDNEKLERFKVHLEIIEKENSISAMAFLDDLEEDKWYRG